MAQGIVKHLVSYMAAAQEDNRLISWVSEPYRTILLFLFPIPFSTDCCLTLIHTFTVHTVNTCSCRYTHTHTLAIFSFWIYFMTQIFHIFFLSFFFLYTEEVIVRWRQGKPGRAGGGNSKDVCSPSLFGLELDLQLKPSSIFHHYYQALWQRDLTVPLTITALNKFTCSLKPYKKIWPNWDKCGEMLKRVVGYERNASLCVTLAHKEMCLLVKEMYSMWW